MTKLYHQKGFTLVELAIVMVIIGLLIGGVLKGQEILKQAKISSTITMIGAIDGATKTFFETYAALPGDLQKAHERLADCAECGIASDPEANLGGTLGDMMVGDPNWDMTAFQSASFAGPVSVTAAKETVLFWLELSKAGLLSGITKDGVTGTGQESFGGSLPAAKVGGGFIVGHAGDTGPAAMPGRPGTAPYSMPLTANVVLALIPRPAALNAFASGEYVLTPGDALQMDTKMDDGIPNTGDVQAYGVTASCYAGGPAYFYNGAVAKKDCGIYARIVKN